MMLTNTLWNLIIMLGCAIVFGLICFVLAVTWSAIKIMAQTTKEVKSKCSPVKTAETDMSDAIQSVKSTNENEQNMTE